MRSTSAAASCSPTRAGALPSLLAARGLASASGTAASPAAARPQPWPPAGPFDVALLRLPKAKDEQEMAAHACLSVLAPGGRLIVYGGNDEGIRSAARHAGAAVRRGRDAGNARPRPRAGGAPAGGPFAAARLAGGMAHGRRRSRSPAAARDWVCYPGIFAAGRIDEGTALLIGALPPLRAGARVLDYGCGSGVIGAARGRAAPGIALELLDNDSRGAGGRARERGRRAPRPRRGARRSPAAALRRHPVQSAAAQGARRGSRAAGAAHRRRAGAPAARRHPADRRAAPHPPRPAAVQALRHRRYPAENGRYRVWRAATT